MKLYIESGLSYPDEYIKVWADMAKGYWNGGYSYWRWYTDVPENDYGIEHTVHSEIAENILNKYLEMFETSQMLQIFLCIGFHVWLVIFST